MKWIYRLERKLGRNFGVTNLMIYITATMLAVYALEFVGVIGLRWHMLFWRDLVLAGEVWRIITFVFIPPLDGNPLFVLLALFVAYHIGTDLEGAWGKALFTMYFVFGVIGAIIAGFITGVGDNAYLFLSILLAYCYLNPDATFLLFFILPIKAKYIAIFNWALYILAFIIGDLSSRVALIFSLINFFIFFGPDVWKTIQRNYNSSRRKRRYQKNWGNNNPWR